MSVQPRHGEFDRLRGHLIALAACVATAVLAWPLAPVLDVPNIVMLFLLAVAGVAAGLGRAPAVTAAFASVALFDFLFVEPRFSFAVRDAQYAITFGVMLAVAILIGELAARLRRQAREAAAREAQTLALYRLARELSGTLTLQDVAAATSRFVREHLDVAAALVIDRDAGSPVAVTADGEAPPFDAGIAATVLERGDAMAFVDRNNHGLPSLALPLRAATRVRGVLMLASEARLDVVDGSHRPLLDAVASLVAVTLERLHFVDVARDALVGVESERLRSSLLAAISHDLRTPLTVLVGLADSLARARPALPPAQAETAAIIRDQALRMSRLAHDLLDMARLAMGPVRLRREWQPLEEVIGSAIASVEPALGTRRIVTDVPADLPLLNFDAVLIERVLANLLDNAIRHAPQGTIAIGARLAGERVSVDVDDEGPGLAPGAEASVFDAFERADASISGTGLGLAICRAIVAAHGGRIAATNRPQGGARFTFTLPVGTPPSIDEAVTERIAKGAV